MTNFQSPYNFVPLSGFVHFPPWDDLVSQDVPFRDGFSGSFDLHIEAKTPIFTKDDADGNQSGFLSHDGTPQTAFIKGSTLRGMLREVVAMASFSKFSKVAERRFGIRNISNSGTPYAQKMRAAKSGWLYINKSGAHVERYIRPCSEARVHREALRKFHLEQTGKSWDFKQQSHKTRNETWLAERDVRVNLTPGSNGKTIATISQTGAVSGRLVFFGFVPNNEKYEKKHGYFFYNESEKRREVTDEVWQRFEWAHSGSQQRPELGVAGQDPTDAWGYWLEQLEKDPSRPVPVYYLEDNSGNVSDFGLAKMFRISSDFSVHDAIKNVGQAHFEKARLDMAELIFGTVGLEDAAQTGAPESLRGRVSITHADVDPASARTLAPVSALLSSPRASFYPAYLRSDKNGKARHWDKSSQSGGGASLNAEVSGWKRYPARKHVEPNPPRNENNRALESQFLPLDDGARFKARVYFHNLRPMELGALLWSLNFGGHIDGLVHQVGMAKPLGYGQVQLHGENWDFCPNDPQAGPAPAPQDFVEEFEVYMSALTDFDWSKSEQIVHLMAMANQTYGDTRELKYPSLKQFQAIKRDGKALGEPDGIDATRQIMASSGAKLTEKVEAYRPLVEQALAARQDRIDRITQAEQDRLARLEEERREKELQREAARRAALTPLQRAQEDIAAITEGQALNWTRTKIHDPETRIADDGEREALRQALYADYYEKWSAGQSVTGNVPHGAAKLKEHAKWLRKPQLGPQGPKGGGGEKTSPYADLPAAEAEKLEAAGTQKGALKALWDEIPVATDWSLPGVEKYHLQALESVHPKPKKRPKSDQQWLKEIEQYLEKRRKEEKRREEEKRHEDLQPDMDS